MKTTNKHPETNLPFVQDIGTKRLYWPQEPETANGHNFAVGQLWAIDLAEHALSESKEDRFQNILMYCVNDALGLQGRAMPTRLAGLLWMTSQLAAAVVGGLGAERIRKQVQAEIDYCLAFEDSHRQRMREERCANLAKARAAKAAKRAAAA